MQKIENKFLYFILILIIFIIWFSIYVSIFKKSVDRNTYAQLINWEAFINDITLEKNTKYKLFNDDILRTTKEDSLAIIEWWDWSITRLWWNTSIQISELFVSNNKDKLNISFELLNWKTWSNVISFIPENSYFKQTFADTEAAVRGTIFNVDLEKDYLYVIDHKVNLTSSNWNIIEVNESSPISLSSLKFIKLDEFIKNIRDNAFDEINRKFDIEFINKLKLELQSKINYLITLDTSKIESLSIEDRNKLYNEVLSSYQELNFIWSWDDLELFNLKLSFKEKLLDIAPESEKKVILESFVYDLKDSIVTKNYDSLESILTIVNSNSQYINIKEQIIPYLGNLNLPDNIKDSLINNINILKSSFWWEDISIIDKFSWVEDTAKNIIWDKINNLINN